MRSSVLRKEDDFSGKTFVQILLGQPEQIPAIMQGEFRTYGFYLQLRFLRAAVAEAELSRYPCRVKGILMSVVAAMLENLTLIEPQRGRVSQSDVVRRILLAALERQSFSEDGIWTCSLGFKGLSEAIDLIDTLNR